MESFFKTLKCELINDNTHNGHGQAQTNIFRYIDIH
ncbi:IS3 family transposase [Eoetvoesiella caeni]